MDENNKVPYEFVGQLCDINYEIKCFLTKFKNFREKNISDSVLYNNLTELLEEIETFMDSEPTEISPPELSDFQIDFEQHTLERVLLCNICEKEVKDRVHSISKHINSPKHVAILKTGKNGGRENKKKAENKVLPERTTLPRRMNAFLKSNYLDDVNKSVVIADALKQVPAYDQIRDSLTKLLCKTYPNLKIYFFGSRVNGLGNTDSDLDIFLDVDEIYNKHLSAEQVKKHIKVVKKALEGSEEWRTLTAILSARTPILQVYNQKHRIDCDISFSSLGQCNTLLINYLIELQPICQQMCLFVKKWFKMSSYSDCFSSYVFSLMIIFHLQQQTYLPPVFILQHCVEPTSIGPWQGNFAQLSLSELKMELIPPTPENLMKQLISFFTFCSSAQFENFIICPYTGSLVVKTNFNNMKEIFERYDDYRSKCTPKGLFHLDKPICVQDPLEHNHNVAKGISKNVLTMFMRDCKLTLNELNKKAQTMD